jgi:hypothetical protein
MLGSGGTPPVKSIPPNLGLMVGKVEFVALVAKRPLGVAGLRAIAPSFSDVRIA